MGYPYIFYKDNANNNRNMQRVWPLNIHTWISKSRHKLVIF
jgi:hypothetical protein